MSMESERGGGQDFVGDFDGELRLRSVTRENKMDGNYTCYVENQSGSDSSTFQVYVQGNFI